MSGTRWTLGRRITALSAAVAVLLGVIALAATGTAAANRAEVTRLTDRISPALVNAQRLLAVVVRQESALRGYALSGQAADLGGYEGAVAQEKSLADETARLLAGEPALLARLRAVTAQADSWRGDIAAPVIALVRAGGPRADQAITSPEARQRFQRLVDAIQGFQDELTGVRDRLWHDVHRTGSALIGLLISAAAVVVLAGAVLGLLLSWLVTRPVVQLGSEVRRVASGEYDHEISGGGPLEVGRLARDINAMRRKIVADLAQVVEARHQVEEANRRLESQAEELTRSNRDLEQFAYVASHDLQEPLRKVAGFCQLLQRRYAGKLDQRADQYIYFAVDGAQRMQRLINDLLAFSRIGRITGGFTDVDLNRVAAEVIGQLDSAREYASGEIVIDELPVVYGEEALLTGLLANLVSNSLKFRHPQRPPRVHVSARLVGDAWEISVADNGIGIAPEFVDKIFVIFQRLHTKDAYPGTGIGLAIAKKIVEYHGGQIWIDTGYPEGTRVVFTLPQPAPAPSDEPAPLAEPAAAPAPPPRAAEPVEPAAEPVEPAPVAAGPVDRPVDTSAEEYAT